MAGLQSISPMRWRWAAASSRGTSHIRSNTRCQDAYTCQEIGSDLGVFGLVVADGAGSASHGGEGAWVVCRTLSQSLREYYLSHSQLPENSELGLWICEARTRLNRAAANRNLSVREFASTLLFVISDGRNTCIAHIGDGCVALRKKADDEWVCPSWPDQGEYASTTFFVTDEPDPKVRFTRFDGPVDRIVAFSDGVERLALRFVANEPHAEFLDPISDAVALSKSVGRDRDLSKSLKKYLDSAEVCARTDDDKTLIILVEE